MKTTTVILALFSLVTSVTAGGYNGLSIGGTFNFGASQNLRSAATPQQKSTCSSAGSFLTDFRGSPICCSDQTRQPPQNGNTCPFTWGEHKTSGCCIPPREVSPCDCGEGYKFDKSAKKCVPASGGRCRGGLKQCRPHKPRSPEPDCDDWDDHHQCCGGHTGPSPPAHNGGGYGGGGYGGDGGFGGGGYGGGYGGYNGGWKRSAKRHQQSLQFPQNDMDRMYCPGDLHACTVPTGKDGEWAYECIDFATELESCGGCAATGQGTDCTAIPHAASVGCEQGSCAVYTCRGSFATNGTACVAA
ncbi:hypothetical protein IAU60_005569 [Kwoniella sp. DSM 27419]